MGTRNLTIIKHDGKYKLSQYGQWDGYPSGQGITILNYLKNMNKEDFIKNLNKLIIIDDLSKEEKEVLDKEFKDGQHLELSRDTGGKVLEMIESGIAKYHSPHLDFIKNSLFCEWAYVIDFDNNTFEVYKGFIKSPLSKSERFYQEKPNEGGYYPCKLLIKYNLNKLPDMTDLESLEKEEEED